MHWASSKAGSRRLSMVSLADPFIHCHPALKVAYSSFVNLGRMYRQRLRIFPEMLGETDRKI